MARNNNKGKTEASNKAEPQQTETAKAVQAIGGAWAGEHARIMAAAKEKAGSRGNALQRCAEYANGDTAGGKLIREACGEAGGQALIEQPRNVLVKLPKLATCIAAKTPWCSLAGMDPNARNKEDASVAVALVGLGAGNARQKENVAQAIKRYPGGANAQMPAALEALAFLGVVDRKPGGKRNAEYAIRAPAKADALIPTA